MGEDDMVSSTLSFAEENPSASAFSCKFLYYRSKSFKSEVPYKYEKSRYGNPVPFIPFYGILNYSGNDIRGERSLLTLVHKTKLRLG